MTIQHKQLQSGEWNKLSLVEQLANIGSEVERSIRWKNKNNKEYSDLAFYRALELIDFTVSDQKNINRLKEVLRMREVLVDYFMGENSYKSSDDVWQKYFYSYNFASRVNNDNLK